MNNSWRDRFTFEKDKICLSFNKVVKSIKVYKM